MNPKKFRGWCLNGCGNAIKKGATKYCSPECMHEHQYQRRVEALETGLYRTTNFAGFLRKYLIRRLGESCTRCGWAQRNPVTKNVPIEVEHIDGDWTNNRLDNLTLLCPNCHALTPTFRGLNRGRGRAHRLGGRDNPLRFHENASEVRRGFVSGGNSGGLDTTSIDAADVAQLVEHHTCNVRAVGPSPTVGSIIP
jgi:hypothetical protein